MNWGENKNCKPDFDDQAFTGAQFCTINTTIAQQTDSWKHKNNVLVFCRIPSPYIHTTLHALLLECM